jgi:hypothetical protein
VPDRVLADLDQDVVAGLEGLLDLAVLPTEAGGLPVDLTGVEHTVAAAADVDEGRLHRGQHVLHDAEVDVADQRRRGGRGDEVLHHHAVLEHGDLGVAGTLVRRFGADLVAHDHGALDGLAAGQELGLAQDRRAAATGVAAVAATLPLGLQPGRTEMPWISSLSDLSALDRGARSCTTVLADRRGGGAVVGVAGAGLAPTAAAATAAAGLAAGTILGVLGIVGISVSSPPSCSAVSPSRTGRRIPVGLGVGVLVVLGALLTTSANRVRDGRDDDAGGGTVGLIVVTLGVLGVGLGLDVGVLIGVVGGDDGPRGDRLRGHDSGR